MGLYTDGGTSTVLPFVLAPGYLSKGLSMMGALRSAGVPLRRGVRGLRIIGNDRAERVEYEAGGVRRSQPADVVLLHQGIVPNVNQIGRAHV